ncbi:MAG: hypothetical protein KME08_11575 [Aphanothece sp. CMT-3BRIN-NPC111]|jgi:hypothetical protein|nr:hypothetical protein [Aphanothece sp. CMT-3BRIN-NPC111]
MKVKQKLILSGVFTSVLAIALVALAATTGKVSAISLDKGNCDRSGLPAKPTGTLKQGSTVINNEDLKSWNIQYELSGGIAGFRRQLTLNSDAQLIASDRKRNKNITKQASTEQIANITMLVKSLKSPAASGTPSRLNSRCADCFQHRVTLTLNEQQQTIQLDDSQLQQDSEYGELVNQLSSILNQTLSQ